MLVQAWVELMLRDTSHPRRPRLLLVMRPSKLAALGSFGLSGRGFPYPAGTLQLEAGALSDLILVTPSRAISVGATVTLTLQCMYSSQRFASVTFVGAADDSISKPAALAYRAPMQCGVVDSCQFVVTGTPSELLKWTPPVWPNSNLAATKQPALAHRAEQNQAIIRQQIIAGL